jgi:phosphoserine aminotransferase
MTEVLRPAVRPARPFFSSGPCAKRPGWTSDALKGALVGRSHRSKPGKAKLKDAIERTKKLLGVPADYRLGIVPASDTGAVEMALWSMLGARPVDLFAWESFSEDWVTDTIKQLKLKDARTFKAAYGEIPDLKQYDPSHDAVFVWNGTTSGVKVPNGDWINTPSMVAVEDYLDALSWAESLGGLKALIGRSNGNLQVLEKWVAASNWAGFLAKDPAIRSNTSVCIAVTDATFTALAEDAQTDALKKMCAALDKEGVALDIAGYRAAPPGLRIWCGATVDKADIEALTPWLDWAWAQIKA